MAEISEAADMRQYLWGVENLTDVPAAAASAAATALEYHCNRINEPATNLSTMFIHYNARLASGDEGKNVGTTIEAAMKAVVAHGCCPDNLWPLDAAKINTRPPQEAYDAAKKFKEIQYYSPSDVFDAISKRYPVPVIVSLPKRCLDEAGRTGALPAPTAEDMRGPLYHHAFVLVAYDKRAGTFTARNCWGKTWGTGGHCTIPIDAFKIISPPNSGRMWIFAEPGPLPQDMPAAVPSTPPVAVAPAAQSEKISDLAAKLKEDIRSSLKKDMEEAQKRIRDMMKKPGQP